MNRLRNKPFRRPTNQRTKISPYRMILACLRPSEEYGEKITRGTAPGSLLLACKSNLVPVKRLYRFPCRVSSSIKRRSDRYRPVRPDGRPSHPRPTNIASLSFPYGSFSRRFVYRSRVPVPANSASQQSLREIDVPPTIGQVFDERFRQRHSRAPEYSLPRSLAAFN